MKKIIFVLLVLLFFSNYGECFPVANIKNGIVTEKDTGLPIKGVVVIRSWDKVVGGPAGQSSEL